jgi:hypothetical protein
MKLAPGSRLRSTACETEVVVVRGADGDQLLSCGGSPMVALDTATETGESIPAPGFDEGTLLGKRYTDEPSGLEVLCTRAGRGSLSLATGLLTIQGAKPLPSSD